MVRTQWRLREPVSKCSTREALQISTSRRAVSGAITMLPAQGYQMPH